jgi:hypothetical protein
MTRSVLLFALAVATGAPSSFQTTSPAATDAAQEINESSLVAEIDQRAADLESKVIAWRRDIHQNPELGNREVRTAKLVAEHLRGLGLEVQTGVAHTGVVGLLRGDTPGPVVALRADMDALPVTEEVAVAFASKVRSTYNGQEVGVMHACSRRTQLRHFSQTGISRDFSCPSVCSCRECFWSIGISLSCATLVRVATPRA